MTPASVANRTSLYSGLAANLAAAVMFALWLAIIIFLGREGAFHAQPGDVPIATLLAILSPPLLFLLLMRATRFRSYVLRIDPVWLVAVQGLRILGAGFLFVYAFGHLPAIFAYTAGWGDVLVAFLAPFAASRLARRPELIRSKWLSRFHFLGLLDFVGAVGSGLIARGTLPFLAATESTAALAQFPLLLIPCFAVPLWICLHLAALAQIRHARQSSNVSGAS